MLFRHHDAAALANALNGLFDADAVVIGGRGGHGIPSAEPRRGLEPQPCSACVSQPTSPAKQPGMSGRPAPATARPAALPAVWRTSGPAARAWASWVVSRATSA